MTTKDCRCGAEITDPHSARADDDDAVYCSQRCADSADEEHDTEEAHREGIANARRMFAKGGF